MKHFTVEQAIEFLRTDADPATLAQIDRMVEQGIAGWYQDPQVEGTFGLLLMVHGCPTNQSIALIYSPDHGPWMNERWDWEIGAGFDDACKYLR